MILKDKKRDDIGACVVHFPISSLPEMNPLIRD